MPTERLTRDLASAGARRFPGEAAALLERLETVEVSRFLETLEPALAADLLGRLSPHQAAHAIEAFADEPARTIVADLEPGRAAALFSRLAPDALRRRMGALPPELAREIREVMSYAPGVAGGIMDPRVMAFRPDAEAREVLSEVRARKGKIHDVFVVDAAGRLTGAVGVPELALADPKATLGELARPSPARVQALAPLDEVVSVADEARLASLPVVDIGERLLGVIRYADLLTATQRDATADLQTMVGVSREERAFSGPWFAIRKRLPWLQINLLTAFLASAVVGVFENTIARFTALAILLPVVAGQSGNTGAQALAVTMRGLALREIRVRHWARVASKELVVGAVNGCAVAVVTAAGVFAWSGSPGLAAVIGSAMICSMIVASFAGASVPMVLILLKQDPAAASSIVLTTVTDVVGFLTFLGFATAASGVL
jgi:magnesium transporter